MLVTATDGVDDPAEKLDVARAFLAEQIEAWSDTEADESALKSVAKGILRKSPEVIYHDEFSAGYAPEMLSQVIARARPFGLAYLCDVEPNVSAEGFFPTEPFATLRARSRGDWARFSSSPISATCARSVMRSSPAAARRTLGATPPGCAASGPQRT